MTDLSTLSRRDAWILATRPKTLPAAVSPVLVGTALAYHDGVLRLLPAFAALVGALLLQIAVNLANDYFDHVSGVDTEERLGPVRVTQSGLIPPETVRLAMFGVIGLAVLDGIYLAIVGGWPIIAVGIASILAALAYSGGPFPLASNGLGDLFVFIFFGLVAVCGTYWVQALTLTPLVVLASIPVGFLITAIIVVNNMRDIGNDAKAGKRTLAVMLGAKGTRIEYLVLIIVSYTIPVAFWLADVGSMWLVLPVASFPLARAAIMTMMQDNDGPTMNHLLADTARLSLVFSLLFSIGLVLG